MLYASTCWIKICDLKVIYMASIIIWPYHEIHGWTYIYLSIQYIRTNTTPRRKFLFLAGNPLPPNKYIIVLECLLHDCQCTVSVVLVTYHILGLYVVMQKYSNTCCTVHMVIANWVCNICHNSGILKRYEDNSVVYHTDERILYWEHMVRSLGSVLGCFWQGFLFDSDMYFYD